MLQALNQRLNRIMPLITPSVLSLVFYAAVFYHLTRTCRLGYLPS